MKAKKEIEKERRKVKKEIEKRMNSSNKFIVAILLILH
jgi:hypothetical protein